MNLAFIHFFFYSNDFRFIDYPFFVATLNKIKIQSCMNNFWCETTRREKWSYGEVLLKFIARAYCHVLLIFFRIGCSQHKIYKIFFLKKNLSAAWAVATILFSNTYIFHYCVYLLPLYLLFTLTLDFSPVQFDSLSLSLFHSSFFFVS